MAKTNRQPIEDTYDDDLDEPVRRRTVRRNAPRRWFLPRLAVMLALLAVCVWFAPTVIGRTSLWKSVVAYAAPQWSGKLDARSLSLGWLTPVVIEGAVVRDAQGQPIAQAARVSSEKTLLNLIQSPSDLGKFTVAEPQTTIVIRSDGSNLEDFLASLPQSGGAMPQLALELTGGRVEVIDDVAKRRWNVEQLNARLELPATGPQKGTLSAAVLDTTNATVETSPQGGEVVVDFAWQPSDAPAPAPPVGTPAAPVTPASVPAAATDLGSGTVQALVRGLPIEALQPILHRLNIDAQPSGPLHADVAANWSAGGQQATIELRQLRMPQASVTSATYLAGDRLQLAVESARGQVSLEGNRITVRDLQLDSDLVQLRGQGSASLASDPTLAASPAVEANPAANIAGSPASPASAAPAVAADNLEIVGQLNLASLAAQLPNLLRLRADTRLTSGQLAWSLKSQGDAGTHRWDGQVTAQNLAAETPSGPFQWPQPIALSAAVVQNAQGWRIEQLRGESRFLQLEGSGTLREGAITGSANLNQLVADLRQLVDWHGLQLAGNLGLDLRWKQGEGNSWQGGAKAEVRNFQLYADGMMPWREDDLRFEATLDGVLDATQLKSITSGRASIISAGDRCDAELTEMVSQISSTTAWPVRFVVQGDLGTWLPRIQAFFPVATMRPSGTIQLVGSGKFSPQSAQLDPTTLDLTDLAIDAAGLSIREPRAKLETTGTIDLAAHRIQSPVTTLASTALAIRADNLMVDLSPGAMAVNGSIDYRGDLERLTSWLTTGNEPRQWSLGGALTGSIQARYQGAVVAASWNSDIDQLTYSSVTAEPARGPFAAASNTSSRMAPQWVEPRVSVAGKAQYDPKTDSMQLESTKLTSSAAVLAMSGTVDGIRTTFITDLQGEIAYDGAGITEKLRPILGDTLQVTGREQRKFALRGPLFPPSGSVMPQGHRPLVNDALQGQGSIGWQEVRYVGLTAGAAELPAKLERGIVTLGPINIPVSEGRITATPRLALNEAQPTLLMERGQVIDRVRLSPEICHTWLKYVAPLLADATRAEGNFSLGLSGASVPLVTPEKSTVGGALVIHRAEVGPGPLAQQYLELARQLRVLIDRKPDATPLVDPQKGVLILPEQQVDFEVIEGRVHHRGLKMTVKDIVITTHGSVGFDQTLDLIAEIPVQDSWIQPGSPLTGLRGRSISIPIRGDLRQPKADGKAITDLGADLVRGAAQGVIEDQLNKGFQKLFGPLQPQTPPAGR